ncbi:UDP-N-acetylmuramoyl-L-alanyl-D-glutamate--2,6-diaminopimelate ligase [Compostibacter hankyongensis]|uniref:UDP-N-acetylmuramoyl-L-alanyl-D-glutamate--2,6-diaminopimelate ligase n=1 Tax=Compostibacter hankyongensis TaxID=1007089 RepID=A0ABP8FGP6_9BACT
MATLQDILYKVKTLALRGSTELEITGLSMDSRAVKPGNLFIAVRGVQADGHRFISDAISRGAVAIVAEAVPEQLTEGITYLTVQDSAAACGIFAANFFGNPSEQLKVVGITGTNGKTTIATLLFKLFSSLGHRCGLLSTIQNQVGTEILPATHTTPDAVRLQELLARMVKSGCEYAFMEVSSHAIHQQRISGIKFTGGIFSNITHDHLDYHKTFDEYIRVKKSFFDHLPATAFALSNADDKRGAVMLQNTAARKATYGLYRAAGFKGKIQENNLSGLVMDIDGQEVHFRLIGIFNAYNLLAVYGAALLLDQDRQDVLRHLSNLTGAEGRFDYQVSAKERILGIVDYAHTPDALLNVLATLKKLRQGHEQIITVIGCGGDRDKTKRPEMGLIAAEHSDKAIFTSDNPRSEDPAAIIHEIEAGVPVHRRRKTLSIADRREAIKTACSLAGKEDIVLVAGKGHEKYQEIKGEKHPFDDKAVLKEMFDLLEK